ncbi:MAG: hypothetical protein ACRDJH_07495 [Thermomicrobiales bacterium]
MSRTTLGFAFLALFLIAGSILGASSALGRAQQAGTPAPGTGVTTEVLGQSLPSAAPGQALWLLRVTFAPGAAAAAHTHPGATIYHLDSGTLTFVLVDGSATLHRATGTEATPAPEEIGLDEEIVLNAGDWISYEGDAVQIERNDGAEPAVILISNLRGEDEPARHAAEGTPVTHTDHHGPH